MNRTASHCYHCHQIVPKQLAVTAEINEQQQLFCCSGCVAVCQTIHVSGLESFYQHIPNVDSLSPPAQNDLTDLESFDLESVQADFVIENDETKQAILLIEGIHCSACVWLIERALNKMPGVQQAIVNLTQKRLKVVWLKNQCVLSDIILQCRQLGYDALPYQSSTALDQYNQSKSNLLYRLGFAGFTMMNLLWISIALYSGADQGEYRYFLQWIAMALATPTLLYSGWPFLSGAYRSIKQGYAGMDVPIAIGALATYLYSAYITLSQSQTGEVYFDTVVNFIFVILIGRYLESVSKYKAVNATQRLLDLQPKIANVIEQNGEIVVKPVKALVLGEVVRIKPGEKIPVDGCVVDGMTEVDESMLTGETNLVGKIIKDDVFAGTLNGAGSIDVKVNGLLTKTVLGKIIQLVESAQMTKAPIQCTTDKIVPWFVLITLSLSMMTFIYWSSVGFESALLAAVSVLIITCPCAFGLATPMSIAVASGVASVHGILIKNGAVFEQLSSIKNIVFDKTGTLTQGKIEVKEMVLVDDCDYSQETLLKWLATLESRSEHPVANAILNELKKQSLELEANISGFDYFPGQGVAGVIDGQSVMAGQIQWLRNKKINID
ncbi:MAG: heavy metal translocating P-type ATPase, partial [Methylococcales bacterium]|nr:heavy metal translocating P-type ATPase [Methylococcales bacterium]